MKPLLTLCMLVLLAATSIKVSAFSYAPHSFAKLAAEADVIVLGSIAKEKVEVSDRVETLNITVKKYLHGGSGAKQFKAFADLYGLECELPDFKGDRLLFLRMHQGHMIFMGRGSEAIWPQVWGCGAYDVIEHQSANNLEVLSELALQIQGYKALQESQRLAVMQGLVSDVDPFKKLVGYELASYLHLLRSQPGSPAPPGEDFSGDISVAAAHALLLYDLSPRPDRQDRSLFNTARFVSESGPLTPPLRIWMNILRKSPVVAEQNNAFEQFARLAGGSDKWGFDRNSPISGLEQRTRTMNAMEAWLKQRMPQLLAYDRKRILTALQSPDPTLRLTGKIWLQTVSGRDFGFKETASETQRATAIKQVETWFNENAKPVEG